MPRYGSYPDQTFPPGTATILIKNGSATEEVKLSDLGVMYAKIIKSVDETVNNNTLQDDDELTIPLAANKRYYYQCTVFFKSDSTPEFKYTFGTPSGTTNRKMDGDWNGAAFEAATGTISTISVPDVNGTAEVVLMLAGYILTAGNAGTFVLQWAQSVTDAADCIVKAGSTLIVYEG